jgi:hypothetical protein
MWKAIKWVSGIVFGLGLALAPGAAQAGFLQGGTTSPSNPTVSGTVEVQVYQWGGVGGGGYGTPIELALATAFGAGDYGRQYLYLYETVNTAPSPDIAQNTVKFAGFASSAPKEVGSQFAATGGAAAGDPSGFLALGVRAIVAADGLAKSPASVSSTASSVGANFIPPPPGLITHSTLWGFTSDLAPVFVSTSIQDGGSSAVGVTYGTVPEPASIVMLTCGAVGMLGYGWKRRKVG